MAMRDKLGTCFLDANVFMYAVGKDHPYRQPCDQIVEAVIHGKIAAVTSTEVLQEIVYHYKCVGQTAEGVHLAREIVAAMRTVLPVAVDDIEQMLEMLESHPRLSPRDALHVAVTRRRGIRTIITADRHFRDIPGITALDPLELAEQLKDETP